MSLKWLAGLAATAFALSHASAATLSNIRIARHSDHVRIVLDLDAAITFSAADGAFTLAGLEAESAVMNAAPADAPLKRVLIAPTEGGARLSFETASAVTPKAFTLTPDTDGGHRLVVDLYLRAGDKSDATDHGAHGTKTVDTANSSKPHGGDSRGAPAVEATKQDDHAPPPASGMSAALPTPATGTLAAAVPGVPVDPHGGSPLPRPKLDTPGYAPETLRAERALDRGDAKEACTLADAALKANATDLRALVVLGGCRLARQDGAGAKAAYSSALAQDPSYDRARVGLATALDMMGDQGGARAELSKVLGHEVPPEELARLVDAFKTLDPKQAASAAQAPAAPQRIVNSRAPAIVRGPAD